jgi:hypothetical protein
MPQAPPKVLYTSGEILLCLKALFAEPAVDDRRVALVAYVGDGASKYLASPSGLQLICNPSAGGTSPHALRKLIQAGAVVHFSAKLHAKVYWSEQRGCIIGSANASTNALGIGGLKEAAVFLPPPTADIDKLIAEAAPHQVTEEALRQLQEETKALPRRFRDTSSLDPEDTAESMDFRGWFDQPYRGSDPWKLGYWVASPIEHAKSALEKAKQEYGVDKISDSICTASGTAKKHDWLLTFQAPEGRVKTVRWLFVDFVVPVSRSDRAALPKDCRFQAVQVFGNRDCPIPPFKITPAFRKAFAKAVRKFGLEEIEARSDLLPSPPEKLLLSTYNCWADNVR